MCEIFEFTFFLGSGFFVYQVARAFTTKALSLYVVLLVLTGPLNSYTAYFKPESLYFFGFWGVMFLAVRFCVKADVWPVAFLGLGISLLSLIKPHALFLLPAFVLHL